MLGATIEQTRHKLRASQKGLRTVVIKKGSKYQDSNEKGDEEG